MKLFVLLLLMFEAIPLATSAQNQQALAFSPASTIHSTANSLDSSGDLESGPERGSQRFSFLNPFKKTRLPTSEFRCHHYPKNSILGDLSNYITDLLRSYRETVFGVKANQERMLFETCYAGYESTNVSPSIYFGHMKPKQMDVVEKLLRNQVLKKFPNVKVVTTSSTIALVLEDGQTIQRRNTI